MKKWFLILLGVVGAVAAFLTFQKIRKNKS
jgi:hypothetical protein